MREHLIFKNKHSQMSVPPRCWHTSMVLTTTQTLGEFEIMAESSLVNSVDSAQVEKTPFASRILLTHQAEGYSVVRIRLGDYFTGCNPSLIHEYLWSLGELIEQAQAKLDAEWKVKLRKPLDKTK